MSNDCQKAHEMKSSTDHTEISKVVRLISIEFSLQFIKSGPEQSMKSIIDGNR